MKNIRRPLGLTVLAAVVTLSSMLQNSVARAATADAPPSDKAPLGSPSFRPTPEHPYGWRGDGSGCFPGATPPVHWESIAKGVKTLRAQATKPKDGDTGQPIPDGVIHDWLILGPLKADDAAKAMQVQGEKSEKSDAAPDAGEKFGALAWKKVATDSALLSFWDEFGGGTPKTDIALALTYIHAESKVKVRLMKEIDEILGTHAIKVYLNGTLLGDSRDFELEKGWNRLLLRVACGDAVLATNDRMSWYVQPILFGAPGNETVDSNIAWSTRLPGWSFAQPVIAGDKILMMATLQTLCCLDKNTGRILWTHTASYYDAATDDEKKAHPEIFKELAPLAAQLADCDKAITSAGTVQGQMIKDKFDLERKIFKLMNGVDKKKYFLVEGEETSSAAHTPITDGKSIWVSYYVGLTLRYDLDGNLKWAYCTGRNAPNEHGYSSALCLIDGKLIAYSDPILALDAETGKLLWSLPAGHIINNASPIAVRTKPPLMSIAGDVIDVQTGKMLLTTDPGLWAPARAGLSSSILRDNMVIRIQDMQNTAGAGCEELFFINVADNQPKVAKSVKVPVGRFASHRNVITNEASPLYYDRLVYMVDVDGLLSVVDANTYEVVYQKMLDVDNIPGGVSRGTLGASPALGGKYIYIFGNGGTCLVIQPGRQYKQISKNRIEHYCVGSEQEFPWQVIYHAGIDQTLSSPLFDGKRMYYRSLSNLYCIEEK